MKKIIIILFATTFMLRLNSQVFDGGLTLGGNLSQIDGDMLSGYDKIGLNIGAFIRIPLGGFFTSQLELKYNNKGAARWGDVLNPSVYMVSLHYIDMPVMLQAWFTDDLFADFGLTAGYLMGAKYVDNAGALPYSPKKYYSDFDFNFLIGLNYLFTDAIGANFRWYYSIIPAYEANTGIYRGRIADILGLKDGYYNNVISLSVYFKINNY
jgi:hypothetical protein